MVAGPILNITAKGLSAGAKVVLKQLKTLMNKSKKTTADRKKITKLKKELNADESVKAKKLANEKRKIKERRKDKETKQDIGDIKSAIRNQKIKGEIDDNYYKELNKSIQTGKKMEFPKKVKDEEFMNQIKAFLKEDARKKGFSTGGLSLKKKYANPVKIVNNLKKR
jgi:hypothetical protein